MCQYHFGVHHQFMVDSVRLVLLSVHHLLVLGNYIWRVSYKLEGVGLISVDTFNNETANDCL